MVTLNDARGAIYTAFVAGWGATSPFLLDNEKFDSPPLAEWARTVVRHAARAQETLGSEGNRKFESVGSVITQCFGPLDSGTEGVDTLAKVAQGIFEGKTLLPENIHFTASVVTEIGPTDDAYQINVEAFFTYTETK
jgi:hypothetical protein